MPITFFQHVLVIIGIDWFSAAPLLWPSCPKAHSLRKHSEIISSRTSLRGTWLLRAHPLTSHTKPDRQVLELVCSKEELSFLPLGGSSRPRSNQDQEDPSWVSRNLRRTGFSPNPLVLEYQPPSYYFLSLAQCTEMSMTFPSGCPGLRHQPLSPVHLPPLHWEPEASPWLPVRFCFKHQSWTYTTPGAESNVEDEFYFNPQMLP